MLHFARRITFGMDVGDFLEFQSAFQRDWIMNAAPEEQKILRARILLGQVFTLFVASEQSFQLARNLYQFIDEVLGIFFGRYPAEFAQVKREQKQRCKLCRKSFGRGYPNLRTGMGITVASSFACNHSAPTVAP